MIILRSGKLVMTRRFYASESIRIPGARRLTVVSVILLIVSFGIEALPRSMAGVRAHRHRPLRN